MIYSLSSSEDYFISSQQKVTQKKVPDVLPPSPSPVLITSYQGVGVRISKINQRQGMQLWANEATDLQILKKTR